MKVLKTLKSSDWANRVKTALALSAVVAVLLIGGCVSPTSNTSPTLAVQSGGSATNGTAPAYVTANATALNAQLTTNSKVTPLENFTLVPDSTPPTYMATIQENGTLQSLSLILAASSTEAQGQFAAQKASYADDASQPNAAVGIDTPTHWRITTDNNTVNVWKVEPNTAGPFGITLDSPYVLVSVDIKPPTR